MEDEILEYICRQVSEFPEGCSEVRLDKDGEICFDGKPSLCDFFPREKFKGVWSSTWGSTTGIAYTKKQWEDGRKYTYSPASQNPKIIQFQVEGNYFYGLGDDGVIYSSGYGSKWEVQVEGL